MGIHGVSQRKAPSSSNISPMSLEQWAYMALAIGVVDHLLLLLSPESTTIPWTEIRIQSNFQEEDAFG
jgi:hypothetical protein